MNTKTATNVNNLETNNAPGQILDDPQLLNFMLEDIKKAPDIYKPTNYWAVYQKAILDELSQRGLHDFRKRKSYFLDSFGACDLFPPAQINLLKNKIFYNRITHKIPFYKSILEGISEFLTKIFPISLPYEMNVEDLKRLIWDNSNLYAQRIGAKPLNELDISLIGNPQDHIEVDQKIYTWLMLSYYMQYVYCHQFVDFNDINVIVELGGGAGKQIEVIKKLHPHITFLLFDIPPQLYVSEQYLKSVFPNQVVSYRETRTIKNISITPSMEGKICIFGNWQFPLLENLPFDLFWNASSFQEMEPEVVENYLKYVNKQAKMVFLRQVMAGKNRASKAGKSGVLKPTTLNDYQSGLKNFEMVDLSNLLHPIWKVSRNNYKDSFWKKVHN